MKAPSAQGGMGVGASAEGTPDELARRLAAELDAGDSPELRRRVAGLLKEAGVSGPLEGLLATGADPEIRRLCARVLDEESKPPPARLAAQLLGACAHVALAPYLAYTRATHVDLLALAPPGGGTAPVAEDLRRARAAIGERLLGEAVAALGWPRVNLGLEVRPRVAVSIRGAPPYFLTETEARVVEAAGEARRGAESVLFVAHGGPFDDSPHGAGEEEPVARFRACNLAHAELLDLFLDVAPLDGDRVRAILGRLDGIVDAFVSIFAGQAEECAILPAVWSELRGTVVAALAREVGTPPLSADLTRLVQTFDDPRSLGAVQNLHGLKRYLHQRGLELGPRLVRGGRAANRTIDLALAGGARIGRPLRRIRYADFEPAGREAGAAGPPPLAIAQVADAFALQMLHGRESFPHVDAFCYGNEVQYYLSFWNHPAFLRVNHAPPLRGGMIDLQYYGVSNYDDGVHPAPELPALREVFRRLDFEVRIENARVRARYDKERTLDPASLRQKIEAVLCFAPYLMDLDWTIGSLDLDERARREVAEAWAERFVAQGAIPDRQVLSPDRRAILLDASPDPTGRRESRWDGTGPYRDRFAPLPASDALAPVFERLDALGIVVPAPLESEARRPVGQLQLERRVLAPLREALAAGAIVRAAGGLRRAPAELYRPEHEADWFARLLACGAEEVARAALVARTVATIERWVRFTTTGTLNGYEVQRARLEIGREALLLLALRGPRGILRLAGFARGPVLARSRPDRDAAWVSNASCDAAALAVLLRRADFVTGGEPAPTAVSDDEAHALRERFRRPSPVARAAPLEGERVAVGVPASPGLAVGRALFGTAGRAPRELERRVLVAPALRPEDNAYLFRAAGIVSTGGGVLSHAGLIAAQFGKPALIVPGRWERTPDGTWLLHYPVEEYREEPGVVHGQAVRRRRDARVREHTMREGDLLALDATRGVLRVLGQERETLGLHEELETLADVGRRLARATGEREVLVLRGRWLRARRQLEKLLARLRDPVAATHAAHELLWGEVAEHGPGGAGERAALLAATCANPHVGPLVAQRVARSVSELETRAAALAERAAHRIPASRCLYEILALRLQSLKARTAAAGARAAVGSPGAAAPAGDAPRLDRLVRARLEELRAEAGASLRERGAEHPVSRHLVRQLERLDRILGMPDEAREEIAGLRRRIEHADATERERLRARRTLAAAEVGLGLHPLVGWKAANLGEIERAGASGLVPAWFVVTDRAFEEVLRSILPRVAAGPNGEPAGEGRTLGDAIADALAESGWTDARKASHIRGLWDRAVLPPALVEDLLAAYAALAGPGADGEPYVAVRSSSREEDTERAARAGEFDTFLFVRGAGALVEHLKRAWSGLWSERAIHNRAVLGGPSARAGGGVVVQRIVRARVSGVLQTVNVATGEPREIVIDAGLGLGEGVVAGTVAVDQFAVAKEGVAEGAALRFRCAIGEKKEKVVFNERAGTGTARRETAHHERLRPALEYVELCDLARAAVRLEAAYGHPLDVEFAIEDARLWLLQARPVGAFHAALEETFAVRPLRPAEGREEGGPS